MAGACPDSDGSRDFSRLNQAFLTPFAGAGGSGWEAGVPSFTLAPSPVGEAAGGGRTPVERKKRGFRERGEDKKERETQKFKTFFSLPVYVQTRSRSIRFNPEKILLIYEV